MGDMDDGVDIEQDLLTYPGAVRALRRFLDSIETQQDPTQGANPEGETQVSCEGSPPQVGTGADQHAAAGTSSGASRQPATVPAALARRPEANSGDVHPPEVHRKDLRIPAPKFGTKPKRGRSCCVSVQSQFDPHNFCGCLCDSVQVANTSPRECCLLLSEDRKAQVSNSKGCVGRTKSSVRDRLRNAQQQNNHACIVDENDAGCVDKNVTLGIEPAICRYGDRRKRVRRYSRRIKSKPLVSDCSPTSSGCGVTLTPEDRDAICQLACFLTHGLEADPDPIQANFLVSMDCILPGG